MILSPIIVYRALFITPNQTLSETQMLTLALFECSNMDEFLDGFIALQGKNWKTVDLNKIGTIVQEIIDDTNKELASIRLYKLL